MSQLALTHCTPDHQPILLDCQDLLLQRFFEQMPIAIAYLDRELRYRFVSQAWVETLGLPDSSHLIGQCLDETLPTLPSSWLETHQRCWQDNQAIREDIELDLPPGKREWVRWDARPWHDCCGQPRGLVIVADIVTQMKQAESAQATLLCESETRFQRLSEASFEAIAIIQNGIVLDVNQSFIDLLGYGRHAAIGMNAIELYPPETQVVVHHLIQANYDQPYEVMLRRHDGSTFIGEVRSKSMQAQGSLARVIAIRDISEARRARIQLQDHHSLLKAQQEASPDGILVIDAERQVASYNRRFCELWRIPDALADAGDDNELLGYVLSTLQQPQEFMAKVEHLYAYPTETSRDEIHLNDGRVFDRYSGPIVSSDGEHYGRIWYFRDMTARKQAELALQRSEAQLKRQTQELQQTLVRLQQTQIQLVHSEKMSSLGQLVAGVAHEINNPVSFIYGNIPPATEYVNDLIQLLHCYQAEYPIPTPRLAAELAAIELDFLIDDLPKLLTSMRVGAKRISDIVRSLRTFSRLDEAEIKPVDVHEGINSTLMMLQNRLKATHERPEIQIIPDYASLPLVECLAGQINQVLMNILVNAIDALDAAAKHQPKPEFAPSITISTRSLDNQQIAIHIIDNGPGMSEAVRQRLFDPFFTTKPVGQGTGLGLSISHQIIVEKHHGQIECRSTLGQGTEFIITIPQTLGSYPLDRPACDGGSPTIAT